ncbi:MAG: hypothetical protein B0D92_05995 [Spirochaeta sp. LUC14_002_19_P3]|nr:MAG: hypothetical protein B0D92_05995 [Spirochaeta sp. LUC14_002_19_P3]
MVKMLVSVARDNVKQAELPRADKNKTEKTQSFSEKMKKAQIDTIEDPEKKSAGRISRELQSQSLRSSGKGKLRGVELNDAEKNKKIIPFPSRLPEESRPVEALLKGLKSRAEAKEVIEGKKKSLSGDKREESKTVKPANTELFFALAQKEEGVENTGKNRGEKKEAPKAELRLKPQTGELPRLNTPNLTSTAGKVSIVDVRKTALNQSSRGEKKTSRSEKFQLAGKSDTSSQTNDARFAIAETTIEIDKEPGIKLNNQSAARVLSDKINGQAGSEIVRQVKVVLNQAQAGEIRINLRPENLGSVRVSIQMEDSHLTGKILVDSIAARDAFRTTLDGLQAKLIESGFSSADIEVLWDDRNSNRNFSHQDEPYGFTDEKSNREKQRATEEFEVLAARPIGYEQINLVI